MIGGRTKRPPASTNPRFAPLSNADGGGGGPLACHDPLRAFDAMARMSVVTCRPFPPMHARVLRRLLIVLLVLTSVALLWQALGLASAVPAVTFRLGIIVAWMASVLGYLLLDGLLKRNQLRLSAASQQSLQRLNESLLTETRNLAELARTDPLTGALNRTGLADELMRTVRLAEGHAFPMTLVFIDIDRFKRINEQFGQDTGDQVIRGLAQLVRDDVQRDDLFARWGGEEFLLVFRDLPGTKGHVIAERLRERIAAAQWPQGLHVTCSFGVAEWHRGEDVDEGIKRADEAMYRAKQNGRNRVEIELDQHPAPESQPA